MHWNGGDLGSAKEELSKQSADWVAADFRNAVRTRLDRDHRMQRLQDADRAWQRPRDPAPVEAASVCLWSDAQDRKGIGLEQLIRGVSFQLAEFNVEEILASWKLTPPMRAPRTPPVPFLTERWVTEK